MDEREEKIEKLKKYFEKREDVLMAFLFGSQAKGKGHIMYDSDWDIAVYFRPQKEEVEWEEYDREYPAENEIWGECTDIVKTDRVDLVVLNRAPITTAHAAIQGLPLVIKDRRIYLEFMLIISREAEDYYAFANDYFQIFLRSASLAAEDAQRLRKLFEFIETQNTLYAEFTKLSWNEYENNLILRGAVERWVENIMNSIIDISKIILASSRKVEPGGYRGMVERAALLLGLPEESIYKLEGWVKFRNVLAHEYLDIKWKKIKGFIDESQPKVAQFIEAARNFLKETGAT